MAQGGGERTDGEQHAARANDSASAGAASRNMITSRVDKMRQKVSGRG